MKEQRDECAPEEDVLPLVGDESVLQDRAVVDLKCLEDVQLVK